MPVINAILLKSLSPLTYLNAEVYVDKSPRRIKIVSTIMQLDETPGVTMKTRVRRISALWRRLRPPGCGLASPRPARGPETAQRFTAEHVQRQVAARGAGGGTANVAGPDRGRDRAFDGEAWRWISGPARLRRGRHGCCPTGTAMLDMLARSLREYAHTQVVVAVYTDAIGSSEFNQQQSRRALGRGGVPTWQPRVSPERADRPGVGEVEPLKRQTRRGAGISTAAYC